MNVRITRKPKGARGVTIKEGELFRVEGGYINVPALRESIGYERELDLIEADLHIKEERLRLVEKTQRATEDRLEALRQELEEYKALHAELVEMLLKAQRRG
jgi:hypothetical protein